MDGTPNPTDTKLHKTITHTGTIVGILTGLIAIASFFGLQPHFSSSSAKKKEAQATPTANAPDAAKPSTASPMLSRRGVGTVHLEGGFPVGEAMLTRENLQAQPNVLQSVSLTRSSNSKEERLDHALVLGNVDSGQLAALWREGTRLLRGVRLSGSSPTVLVKGHGISASLPVDSDGRLRANVLWPAKDMFLQIEFAGPLEVGGLTLSEGIAIGDLSTDEPGSTLPTRFSLDIPKPGEVLSSFRGQATYAGVWDGARYVIVRALGPSSGAIAAWSAELKQGAQTEIKTTHDGVLDQGLAGLRIQYSPNPS